MSFKTVLVPLDGTEISLKKLPTALAVAKRFDGHLHLLYLRRDPQDAMPFVFSTLASKSLRGSVLEAAVQEQNELARMHREKASAFCAEHGIELGQWPAKPQNGNVSASWHEADADSLVGHSRLSDITTVVRTPNDTQPWLLESVLLESARPVLLVPPAGPAALGERVVIGWNASAEATRAVAAALPLLRGAEAVTVLAGAKYEPSAAALIDYLRWHGVSATAQTLPAGHKTTSNATALLNEAATLNADLLVIGGYSHTRARQLMFGGVTQYVLSHAELPVLMAH